VASDEADYCHSVEDFFAALRGRPHTLSPNDVHLLRTWWREGVPLAAVTAGISEVVARRRERGEEEPVSSLVYCRHAVRRQAKELAELRAGSDTGPAPVAATDPALADLGARLDEAAARIEPAHAAVATAVATVTGRVRDLAGLPATAVDEQLYALEEALLEACLRALPAAEVAALEERARSAAAASGATEEARERTFRAHRDRDLRELLGLPRLELV